MKIAVLFPNSTTHKQLGYDFYLAIQYALAYKDIHVEWMSASIGFGVDEVDMLSKAEDMLLNRGADLLIVFADYPKISHLFPLLEAMNKEMLIANMGAKLPESWERHPLVFHLNLHESLIGHVGGKILHQKGVTTVTLASNYYDGGYAPSQLTIDSFMHAGGEVDYNFIPQTKGQVFSIEPLTSYLDKVVHDVTVIASYSNPLTSLFLTQWKEANTTKTKQLWCSSTLLMDAFGEDPLLLSSIQNAMGIQAWYRELDTPENQNFVKVFEQKLNRQASFFGALGWDTGLLIAKGIALKSPSETISLKVIMDNADDMLDLTRGKAMLDSEFNTVIAPAYKLYTEDNQMRYEVIKAENMMIEWQDLKSAHPTPNQNGWLNTYLCS